MTQEIFNSHNVKLYPQNYKLKNKTSSYFLYVIFFFKELWPYCFFKQNYYFCCGILFSLKNKCDLIK